MTVHATSPYPAALSCKKTAKPAYSYTTREVTLVRLLSNGRSIIASDGLQPGDQVVSAGIHHIKDGETVTPLPAASDTNIGGLL